MRFTPALLLGLTALALMPAPSMSKPPSKEDQEKAAIAQAKAAEEQALAADEETIRKVGLHVDGAALLDYFRQRTFPESNAAKVAGLVRKLGSDDFPTREKAQADLVALGPGALIALRKAQLDPDPETRRRVHDLVQRCEEKADPAIQSATARLIGARKPAGAAAVLMNYLPFAADDSVVDEVCTALAKVAVKDGKADATIAAALTDKLPLKRAAAGAALAQSKDEVPAVRKLLTDPDVKVRLRVAMAVVHNPDKTVARDALPALINLLGDLQPEQLWGVQDVLTRLAGDKAPDVSLGSDAASRLAAKKAWQQWWSQNKDKVDLAAVGRVAPFLGYTLYVQQVPRFNPGFARIVGEVVELDARGKVRWRFDVDGYPVDARVIGPKRILVTEYHARRVTERNTKGEILWQRTIPGGQMPIAAQRLANGNTFVVTQNRLMELNPKGEEVWGHQAFNIFRGLKLRNGEVVFLTGQGTLTRLDAKGREIKTIRVGNPGNLFGAIDVLPNGHVLVPLWGLNCVIEYDNNGREIRRVQTQLPNSAVALPNGHILVSSMNTRRLVELDRTGREVWSQMTDGQQVFVARKR
jgi:hypothetical protein